MTLLELYKKRWDTFNIITKEDRKEILTFFENIVVKKLNDKFKNFEIEYYWDELAITTRSIYIALLVKTTEKCKEHYRGEEFIVRISDHDSKEKYPLEIDFDFNEIIFDKNDKDYNKALKDIIDKISKTIKHYTKRWC